MGGGDVRSTEFCDGAANRILLVASGSGVADATDLLPFSSDFSGGVCMAVGLSGLLCGLYGAREFSESNARSGVTDDVCHDGVNCVADGIEPNSKYWYAGAGSGISDVCDCERIGIFDERGMVHTGDSGLGIKLYFDVFTCNDSSARTG